MGYVADAGNAFPTQFRFRRPEGGGAVKPWVDIALVVALYCLGCIGGWLWGYAEATMRWTGMWPYQHRRAGRRILGRPPDGEDVARKAEEEL